jgi:CRISPR-associated protein Cas2
VTVLLLERVSKSVRGDLSRWLLEVQAGVFVGHVTPRVRDALWERAVARSDEGSVLMLWRAPTEQGFDLRAHNPKGDVPVDCEGIWLMLRPDPNPWFDPLRSRKDQKRPPVAEGGDDA